jgi:dTDP-4-dehydrorhamnose 3,5-epimerase-like enzyme
MKLDFFYFDIKGDERGSLIAIEECKDIPFEIKRVYYIFDTKKAVKRGCHAHKNLQQVAICIHGSCKFHLDNGKTTSEIVLNSPQKGLFIDKMVWREMYDFTPDCVLMVLASDFFSEEDYLRNYSVFRSVLCQTSKS